MAKDETALRRASKAAFAELSRVGAMDRLAVPLRTVIIVEAAQGIIDNGGLQYFLENDWPNQPPYAMFVEAYREIGAAGAADALVAGAALFPFKEPHRHQERRRKFLDQFLDGGGHRADSPFEPYTDILCGNKDVWRLLDEYVRRNEKAFGL